MKIGICGHFGGNKNCLDGQTVKTKNVYSAIIKEFGEENVVTVDTVDISKRFLSVFFARCKNITDRLTERKRIIINEAVTGKIKVL